MRSKRLIPESIPDLLIDLFRELFHLQVLNPVLPVSH